ncbi:MAG: S-adenosylmethionine:tRNA ribosyltransferase-isomerase [Polyangiaceae bacterium]
MIPASAPERRGSSTRLLHVDARSSTLSHRSLGELPQLLSEGDVLVVNDAATLPASLRLQNFDAELRLVAHAAEPNSFVAVAFGAGDYRVDTDARPAPPALPVGTRLVFTPRLEAVVTHVDAKSARLLTLRFTSVGSALWSELYRHGRPIQYRHVPRPLALWDVQNVFASRPFAFELASAGLPFDHALLAALKRRGVLLHSLTHAAGISATGSAELDARLPLPERYEIPESTRLAVEAAQRNERRVIAVGTTVVRALEASALENGCVRAGLGEARLRLGPGFQPRVVDGLVTGMHEPGSSHFELLRAFASAQLLERAASEAEQHGYHSHEFGDSCLLTAGRPVPSAVAA